MTRPVASSCATVIPRLLPSPALGGDGGGGLRRDPKRPASVGVPPTPALPHGGGREAPGAAVSHKGEAA